MSTTKTLPIRLSISSERYEIAGTLFSEAYENAATPQKLSPAEELLMGIFSDTFEDDESGEVSPYFVKPADPAVLRAQESGESTDAIERTEFITAGHMTVKKTPVGETVSITYDETELSGMEGATSTITYCTDDPGLVTMTRSGTVRTAMTFRAHHRAICSYDTPYMPFEVCIHALTVDNRLGTLLGGTLVLDYLVEIRGGVAERCTLRMTVSPDFGRK